MAREKQKTNMAALHHQKHFWGSLLLGFLLWIIAAVTPLKYEDFIFIAITGGIFCGFYAFMVVATYDSSGRLRPRPYQIQQERDEHAMQHLAIDDKADDRFEEHALEEMTQIRQR